MSNIEVPCLPLGLHAVVSLDAAPVLKLAPQAKSAVVKDVKPIDIPIEGTCENLIKEVPCTLTWRLAGGLRGVEDDVFEAHPRECVIEPNGSGQFKVKEKGGASVRLSPFDINLYGTGKFGYIIKVGVLGDQTCELAPAASNYEVNLPIRLACSATNPKIGAQVDLTVECAPCLKNYDIEATITENSAKGDARLQVVQAWTAAELAAGAAKPWWVGCGSDPSLPGASASFVYSGNPGAHRFVGSLEIPESKSKGARKLQVHAQDLATTAHPELKDFTLGLHGNKLRVHGSFSGFDDKLSCPLDIGLYVLLDAGDVGNVTGTETPRGLWEYVKDPLVVGGLLQVCQQPSASTPEEELLASPIRAVLLEGSKFAADVFDVDVVGRALLERLKAQDTKLFATVGFPANTKAGGGSARPVFATVATYGAAIKSDGEEHDWDWETWAAVKGVIIQQKFTPFASGGFSWMAIATDVCSNLLSMSGKMAALEAPYPGVAPDKKDEYEMFVATVAGESLGGSPRAWKGVACVILNRVGRYEWKEHKTPKAVIEKTGFDAYKQQKTNEPYQDALRFLRGEPLPRTKNLEAIRELVKVVTPLYLGTAPLSTKAIIFVNPQVVDISKAAPNIDKVSDCTVQVLGSPPDPRDKNRFAFRQYKQEAPPFEGRQRWG